MSDHKDYHIKDGEKHWSVTTCLGIINRPELNQLRGFKGNIEMDRIMNEAGEYGLYLHDRAKDIIKANGFYMTHSPDAIQKLLINKFSAWACEHLLKIKHFEKRFFSTKHKYCGRIDGLYLLKGKKGFDLCDIKTGTSRHYVEALQLAAYKNMLVENGVEVNDRIIIECKRDDSPVKAIKINSNYKTDLYNFLYAKALYLAVRNNK